MFLCVLEKTTVPMPKKKALDLQAPPSFSVPLRRHVPPEGYECSMSCAINGDPTPHVTWYLNDISLNTNSNYYISNVCGVCSLLILRVSPKDVGEYKVVVENKLGTAESSMLMNIRGDLKTLNGESMLCLLWISKFTSSMCLAVFLLQAEEVLKLLDTSWPYSLGKYHIQTTFLEVWFTFS